MWCDDFEEVMAACGIGDTKNAVAYHHHAGLFSSVAACGGVDFAFFVKDYVDERAVGVCYGLNGRCIGKYLEAVF